MKQETRLKILEEKIAQVEKVIQVRIYDIATGEVVLEYPPSPEISSERNRTLKDHLPEKKVLEE